MARKFSLLAFLSLLIATISFAPVQVSAVAGAEFKAGRIVDDAIFFNSATMNVTQIQNFLNSKVPVCDTNHPSTNPDNQPPFTCLKDYRQETTNKPAEAGLCNGFTAGNKSAAEIIHQVAQSCGVNPQVLIILLQKEQSLITDTWPWNIQYRSATGYGCPDTAPCDAEYYGFFNQVYAAARQYRRYAKSPELFNYRMGRDNYIQYNPNAACGGTQVYVQNQATAGLYNYTPYQPNAAALGNLYGTGDGCSAYGNRNFWRMFNDWFGSTIVGAVPSPMYKSRTTHTIYVIAGGKKYTIPSFEVMVNYGLHRYPAAEVDDNFLSQYPTAATLTSIGKKEVDPSGALYLFDDGKRYPVNINDCAKMPNGTAITTTSWGLDCFNAGVSKTLANELIDIYTTQDIALPQVILNNNTPWKMEGGKKRRITHPLFVDILGGWDKARWMKDNNAVQAEGKILILNESVVKFSDTPTIYYLTGEQLRPIPGPGEFTAWGFDKMPVQQFPSSYNSPDSLPIGAPMKYFAKDNAGNYYMLAQGNKLPIANPSDWELSNSTNLNDGLLSRIPSKNLPTVFRSDDGTIFTVFNKKRYIFPTPDDLYNLGFKSTDIQQVPLGTEADLTYGGMHLSSGRLFKVNGSDQIRVVSGSLSLNVNSTTIPGLPYGKLVNVDSLTGSRYPVAGTYNP